MSTDTLKQRPIFGSEEQNLLTPIRPPVSKLAIGSFILGLLSSVAVFNLDLVAVPILAAAVGLAAFLFTANGDAVRGQTLSLIGMALGILFAVTCYTSTHQRDNYLYKEGGKFAGQFLQVVGAGKLLQAYELTRSEPERQVAGTSLETAYENASQMARENIDTFKKLDGVIKVANIGPNADWVFDSGVRVMEIQGQSIHVVVRMLDRQSQKSTEVTLNRDVHLGVGSWHVVNVK